MDAPLWFRDWSIQYDGFPSDYLAIDIETTGSCLNKDIIVQLGWCKVKDHKMVENKGLILNWMRSPYLDTTWLKKRLDETAKHMSKKEGKIFPWTFDKLSEGENPIHALATFLELLSDARTNGELIVAHNGICFDIPILKYHFDRFLKIHYDIRDDEIWDTGALTKAFQSNEIIYPGEMPGAFAYRVLMRSNDKGIKWSLHDYCIPQYKLVERFNLDLTLSHTAPFDAYICHLVLEDYFRLSNLKK